MYDDLLRIKQHREQTAANEVLRQKRRLEESAKSVEQARQDAAEYHDYRLQREISLFDEIKNRTVLLRDLENMKLRVALLREKEADMEARILEAEKQLTQVKQDLEQARQQHMEAVREQEKFKQFMEVQWENKRREEAIREEQELEESVEGRHYSGNGVE